MELSTSKPSSFISTTQWALLLLIIGVIVFVRVLPGDFLVLDDGIHVTENPHLTQVSTWKRFWEEPYRGLYVPVTYTFWGATRILSDRLLGMQSNGYPKPLFFRVLNFVFHLVNAVLLFLMLRYFASKDWVAFLGAALFLLHPVQTEVVGWVSSLKDLTSMFFCLLAIWQFLQINGKWTSCQYWIATLCFGLALLSKPSVIPVPLILFGLISLKRNRFEWRVVPFLIPWLLGCIAIVKLTAGLQPWESGTPPTFWLRPFLAMDAIAFYLYKFLWPFNLSIDYARSPHWVMHDGLLFWTPLVAIGAFVALGLQKQYRALIFLALAILMISPVLGFFPFAYQQFSTVANRYLYLAFIPICVAVTYLLERYDRFSVQLSTVGVLTLLAVVSWNEMEVWRVDSVLLPKAMRDYPRSVIATNNWATVLEMEGKLDEAEAYYRRAQSINSDFIHHTYNIGNIRAKQGRYAEAIPLYNQVLEQKPKFAESYYGLGRAYFELKKNEMAEANLKKCIELEPAHFRARGLMGKLMTRLGRLEEAKASLRSSLAINRYFPPSYKAYADILIQEKKLEEAQTYLQTAVNLNWKYTEAHYKLGEVYANLNVPEKALKHWKFALQLDPSNTELAKKIQKLEKTQVNLSKKS